MPATPVPGDVNLDAADFDGDAPPKKKTRVDNSRATHDPHETFEGKTWLEYASANNLDLGANGEVSRMWERQWRAKAQQERDKAGWAEPPGPKRVRVPSDVHGGITSDVYEDEDDVADLFGDFDQEAPSAPGASGSGDPWRPRDEHGHVIETLIGAGCDRGEAVRSVNSMMLPTEATFMELYGRGGITADANATRRSLNVKGLGAFDLRTLKPDGTPWDFSRRADRKMAMEHIDTQHPDFVVGSPPCTVFCVWNQHMNYPKMDPDRVAKLMAEGRMHLKFMAKIYKKQLDQGRHFLHEHPATAVSWDERSIVKLMAHSDVHVTVADQCQYGLKTRGEDGTPMPALKPTRFMTSSVQMSKLLQKRCKKDHKHQPLVSGRCAAAAFYPARLIRTIIKGIRATKDAEGLLPQANGVHAVVECDASVAVMSKCKKVGGGQITITFDDRNFKPLYRDEYTNEILPAHLIKATIIDELDYFN